ncbi:MAG: hypothetical protein JNM22_11865 [Saprospiraceae bacterium]|nr:hypothetical protein [Saprospiraceae bacterium]
MDFVFFNKRLIRYTSSEGGQIRKNQKEVAARPLKISLNPQNPFHPRSHPSTRGVAEQILRTPLMMNDEFLRYPVNSANFRAKKAYALPQDAY